MRNHQIYGVIEFRDDSVKILIGKFDDNRLNILFQDEEEVTGIVENHIVEWDSVLTSVTTLIRRAEAFLELPIKSIVLSLSAMKTKMIPHQERFEYATSTTVTPQMIQEIHYTFYQQEVPGYYVFALTNFQYWNQGLVSLKPPYEEVVSQLDVSVDLLLVETEMVNPYLRLFSQLEIELLSLSFDALGLVEESSVLRQSDSVYNVIIDVQARLTHFHLFNKSTYSGSGFIQQGYYNLLESVQEIYPLDLGVLKSLVARFVRFQDGLNNDNPIYCFEDEQQQELVISREKLYQQLREPLQQLISAIDEQCSGIVESGRTTFVLVQDFVDFVGSKDLLESFSTDCVSYVPDTLGVRQGKWTNLLGQLFLWKEQCAIRGYNSSIIDDKKLSERLAQYRNPSTQSHGKSDDLISKLKTLI